MSVIDYKMLNYKIIMQFLLTEKREKEGENKRKVFLKVEYHLINVGGMMEMGTTLWQAEF